MEMTCPVQQAIFAFEPEQASCNLRSSDRTFIFEKLIGASGLMSALD
jgi:hypothetical protein